MRWRAQRACCHRCGAGKIDFSALLVIRRDALETRREHLDRQLEAALAAVDYWAARGAP